MLHLNRPYMMNTVAGIVSRRVVDCGASACAHFLDLVASVPFIGVPFVFVHSILFGVVGVERDIVVVVVASLFHCNRCCSLAWSGECHLDKIGKSISILFARQ